MTLIFTVNEMREFGKPTRSSSIVHGILSGPIDPGLDSTEIHN